MFDYDDEIQEIRNELETLQTQIEDLIPGTPEFRELEMDITETEERLEEALNREPSFEEALALAQETGNPEDWAKVREIGSPPSFQRLSFAAPTPQPIVTNLVTPEEEEDDLFDLFYDEEFSFFELDLDFLDKLIGDFFRDVF